MKNQEINEANINGKRKKENIQKDGIEGGEVGK